MAALAARAMEATMRRQERVAGPAAFEIVARANGSVWIIWNLSYRIVL